MNLVNFIKRQNLPSKINMIKIQLKNGYVYSTGVSLVNNLNVVVSPMVRKVGSVALSPRGDWRMPSDANVQIWLDEKSKQSRTACSSFFIDSVFYPFNKSFH